MAVIRDAETAIAELRRRGLPDVFERIWSSGGLGPLGCVGRAPGGYFRLAADLAARVPGASGLCPLWEQNGEAVVGQLPSGAFVRVYYEDAGLGDQAIEPLGENYEALVETTLTELVEAGLWDWFDRVASALAYPHADRLRAQLEAGA
jgi:hypothetical protein